MAIDVLFRESQRRYAAALSPFERQSIKVAAAADVQQITGLPPAVLLSTPRTVPGKQGTGARVGEMLQTSTCFADLFLRFGEIACPACGGECESYDVRSAAQQATQVLSATILIIAPLKLELGVSLSSILQVLQQTGYTRLFIDAQVVRHDELSPDDLAALQEQELLVVIDRVRSAEDGIQRIEEAARTARAIGRGRSLFAQQNSNDCLWLNQMLTCKECASVYGDQGVDDLLATPNKSAVGPELFGPEHISLGGSSLAMLLEMRIDEVLDLTNRLLDDSGNDGLPLEESRVQIEAQRALLRTTVGVSLGHLRLNRFASQLSTGEYLRLIVSLGLDAKLAGILYVCETSISGLDREALAQTLILVRQLVSMGNTVILLDNDPMVHDAADIILWFDQGRICTEGSSPPSPIPIPTPNRREQGHLVRHLPDVVVVAQGVPPLGSPMEVALPLGQLTCVTGLSGSGKSTLLREVLLPALSSSRKGGRCEVGHLSVTGANPIRRVRLVSDEGQFRGTVMEMLGLFDKVTGLFARTPLAQQRGYTADWFQLARPGGRCPSCEGSGRIRHDMEFLDDIDLPCPVCQGRRFQPEVLEVTWRGRTLADVLMMSVIEAAAYLAKHAALSGPLSTACSFGLAGCLMGQQAASLDNSVALRVQLCAIRDRTSESDLLLLDSPLAGAHPRDVNLLLDLLAQMVDRGATVVVAETRMDVVEAAGHVIRMGPGRGDEGGRLVA